MSWLLSALNGFLSSWLRRVPRGLPMETHYGERFPAWIHDGRWDGCLSDWRCIQRRTFGSKVDVGNEQEMLIALHRILKLDDLGSNLAMERQSCVHVWVLALAVSYCFTLFPIVCHVQDVWNPPRRSRCIDLGHLHRCQHCWHERIRAFVNEASASSVTKCHANVQRILVNRSRGRRSPLSHAEIIFKKTYLKNIYIIVKFPKCISFFEIVVYLCSCWHLPNLATLSDLTIKNQLEKRCWVPLELAIGYPFFWLIVDHCIT